MKTIALLLAATGALFLSSCASTMSCAKCASCATCSAGTKACCVEAAKKGMKCKKCAAMSSTGMAKKGDSKAM